MKGTYLVYIIQAYDTYDKEADVMTDVVTLELIAETEELALERATQMVKKNGYRTQKIIEKEHGT